MNKIPLEPEKYYHIFNHANGKEELFKSDDNFNYFLSKYQFHISPIGNTFAYCLMPNHFHIAIQIKCEEELLKVYNDKALDKNIGLINDWSNIDISHFISQQFSNLFTSYAQAFNKQQGRRGSLFIPNFERKEITSDNYFKQLVRYIHYNPIHHGFTSDITKWKYSSYNTIINKSESLVAYTGLLEFFNNISEFQEFHNVWNDYNHNQKSSLEI